MEDYFYCDKCGRTYDYELDECVYCGETYCEYCGLIGEGVCHSCSDEMEEDE